MERWWGGLKLINGTFKGGGAKGIAYAGALSALRKRDMWFGSVAGTSAGAITASLIAAGYQPDEMIGLIDELLLSIKRRLGLLWAGVGDAAFDGKKLRSRLEHLFQKAVGRSSGDGRPVTFAELHAQTGITLYVVALDLSRSQPVVFSVHTTPDVSVSAAVMASSAIPGAFPSVRAVFTRGSEAWAQRLVDGGAWANFPRFIYNDPSFACWVERHCAVNLDDQRARPSVGFALGIEEDDEPMRPDRLTLTKKGSPEYDRGVLQDSTNPVMWAIGGLLSGRVSRVFLLAGWLSLSFVLWVFFRANVRAVLDYPYLQTLGVTNSVGLIFALAIMVGLAIGTVLPLAVIGFSRPLGDVIVPSAKAALAVGTGVAPWVGAADGDHIVKIGPGELSTLKFSPDADAKAAAIAAAERTTLEYIDEVLAPDGPPGSEAPARSEMLDAVLGTPGTTSRLRKIRAAFRPRFGGVWVAGFVVAGLLAVFLMAVFVYFSVYYRFSADQTLGNRLIELLCIVAILVTALICLWFFCAIGAAWRHGVARTEEATAGRRNLSFVAAGTLAVVAAALFWHSFVAARNDARLFDQYAAPVTITSIFNSSSLVQPSLFETAVPGQNYSYTFTSEDPRFPQGTGVFWSAREYRLFDRVFLSTSLWDWGPEYKSRLTEYNNDDPDPWPAVWFGLGVIALTACLWICRILRRIPGLRRIHD